LGFKNCQKFEVNYVEYLKIIIKIWSQTGSKKLSRYGEKSEVKIGPKLYENLDKEFYLTGSTGGGTGRSTGKITEVY
jgi:hypothetical protein